MALLCAGWGCGKNERTDPKKMYAKVQATYASLSSFQCEAESVSSGGTKGQPASKWVFHCQIRWSRPQHIRILWSDDGGWSSGDGKTNAIYESGNKVFVRLGNRTDGDPLPMAFLMPSPFSVQIDGLLPRLLLGKVGRLSFVPLAIGPDIIVNGTPCYSLTGTWGKVTHPNVTLAIAKDTFWILQVSESHTSEEIEARRKILEKESPKIREALSRSPMPAGFHIATVVTYHAIIPNPTFDDAAFTFVPASSQSDEATNSSSMGKTEVTLQPPTADQIAKIFSYTGNVTTSDSGSGDWGFGKVIWKRDYSSANQVNGRVTLFLLKGGTHLTAERKKALTEGAAKGGRYAPSVVTLQTDRHGYISDSTASFSSSDGKYDVIVNLWQAATAGTQGGKIKVVSLGRIPNKPQPEQPATILAPAIQHLDALMFPQ
jgi:hypothetical protein